jgi:hypothetical protein
MLAALVSAVAGLAAAQQATPPATPPPNPAQTGTPPQTATPPASAPQAANPQSQPAVTPVAKVPEPGNQDIDRIFSIEASYSYVQGQPTLTGGAAFAGGDASVLDYTGRNTASYSAAMIIPMPARADIRLSYWHFLGSGAQTLNVGALSLVGATYFGVPYAQGNYLAPSYSFQQGEISYEYLSLPWPAEEHKFRLYTLFNIDYFNISTVINGPYLPTISTTGNEVTTIATGGKDIIFPSFGLKIEYPLAKSVRVEASVAAFGFPRHAGFWEADANASIHITSKLEFVLGGRALYYKTSPQSDEYFHQTVIAPYAGLRYYLPSLR